TTTVGGTTSGYSLIGNWNTAMEPVITNSSDSTAAMIGRSTKNWAMFFMQRVLDEAGSRPRSFFCSSPCAAGGGWEGVTLLLLLCGGLEGFTPPQPSPAARPARGLPSVAGEGALSHAEFWRTPCWFEQCVHRHPPHRPARPMPCRHCRGDSSSPPSADSPRRRD